MLSLSFLAAPTFADTWVQETSVAVVNSIQIVGTNGNFVVQFNGIIPQNLITGAWAFVVYATDPGAAMMYDALLNARMMGINGKTVTLDFSYWNVVDVSGLLHISNLDYSLNTLKY